MTEPLTYSRKIIKLESSLPGSGRPARAVFGFDYGFPTPVLRLQEQKRWLGIMRWKTVDVCTISAVLDAQDADEVETIVRCGIERRIIELGERRTRQDALNAYFTKEV